MGPDTDGARSPLFHTFVGRNFNILVPDSGAISDSPQLHVSSPHTHTMGDNILEDCLSPQMGDCAHIHIGTQPSGEVSGQGWGEYRVRPPPAHIHGAHMGDDRSRGTHNRATDSPQYTDGRDKVTDCRLPSLSAAAQNHAISAGGTPPSQPADEGRMTSQEGT